MLLFAIFLTVSIANAYVIPFRKIADAETGSSATLSVFRPSVSVITLTVTATMSDPSMSVSSASSTITSTVSSSPASSHTVPTTSTTLASSTPNSIPTSSSQKFVVAHHMVGNTFPYTLQDWENDITLAHASGIDGFALNLGRDEWETDQVANAYEAAINTALDFKLFFSLDMTSLPCSSPDDAQALRSLVLTYMTHPNQFTYREKTFVSTFAGEACTFGQSSTIEGWKSQFVQHSDLADKLFFVPSFFIDPQTFSSFKGVMHGDFNWNSAWPVELTTSVAESLLNEKSSVISALLSSSSLDDLESPLAEFIGSTKTDLQHIDGLSSLQTDISSRDDSDTLIYMASVSPWFFTHYGPDTFNKNFVYLGDQHLYARRWEALIDSRDQLDIVEINTWNDYGESHYIGPIKGAQPNSEAWTDGMDHTGWLGLTQYYATAFKTGVFPAIEQDQIYMWSRTHSRTAQAQSDSVGQPTNFELFQDAIWAVVLASEPASVTLRTSDTNFKTFDVPSGLSKLSLSISPGDTMQGTIERNGQTVIELRPSTFSFQGDPQTFNFNAFVASASSIQV